LDAILRILVALQAAAKAGLVANSSTTAAAADGAEAAAPAAAAATAAAAGEAGVAHAVHQRLLAAACVQKQLAQQAAEFKRRFGEQGSTASQQIMALRVLVLLLS
jgi:L-asparaginase/Glu-tRNA(Gln) amidotransferase subunit D